MTDTNQKLREALQALLEHYVELVNSGDAGNWDPEAEREVIAARQALALPTADHIPDAGEMINGLTQSETDASASVSGLTAAPVGEREAFEHDLSKSPFEFDMDRWPDNAPVDWPGSYKQYHVQCAWDAWQARAALSAGDAVDAQRYRWLKGRSQVCLNQVWIGGYTTRQRDSDFLSKEDALSAIDSAIDAAMRKGQL